MTSCICYGIKLDPFDQQQCEYKSTWHLQKVYVLSKYNRRMPVSIYSNVKAFLKNERYIGIACPKQKTQGMGKNVNHYINSQPVSVSHTFIHNYMPLKDYIIVSESVIHAFLQSRYLHWKIGNLIFKL